MNSIDLTFDHTLMDRIRKHVEFRNCIQHNNGQLTPDVFKRLGVSQLTIKRDNQRKLTILKEWDIVILTKAEVISLCDTLQKFAQELYNHVDKRIPSRAYIKPKDVT